MIQQTNHKNKNLKPIDIPECKGYEIETLDGKEFDCEYENAPLCEDCIINYFRIGGIIDPRTGEQYDCNNRSNK